MGVGWKGMCRDWKEEREWEIGLACIIKLNKKIRKHCLRFLLPILIMLFTIYLRLQKCIIIELHNMSFCVPIHVYTTQCAYTCIHDNVS